MKSAIKSMRQIIRLLQINTVLAKNGLDEVIVSLRLFRPFRFVTYANPWNWFRREKLTRGEALRKTLEELGPIFVKFGQALSTRPDAVPADIAVELCKLQDKVPPFPSDQVLAIIETTFGKSVNELFAQFDMQPLASASVAQVHAATLPGGEDVVVKILRPNMHKTIKQDLDILYTIARLANRYWSESRRFKPKEIVEEFKHTLLSELNLLREAGNASQLGHNFKHSPLLYIPKIYWDYVRKNVLVMERIYGIPVADVARMRECGIDIKRLAERGVEIFFTQVLRDNFFHADMHPGNIFVSPQHLLNPQYICVDFGIVGTLSDNDKRYLAENLLAFFNRDYRRIALLHIESEWVDRNIRIEEFEMDIRTVCEPIFEKPLKDISFAMLVFNLFQVARRYNMVIQPQLVLLQKTLLAVEGLGRQIYPELDLWATAKPLLEKWLKEQLGFKALLHNMHDNLSFWVDTLPRMPGLLNDILSLTKEQKIITMQRLQSPLTKSPVRRYWYKGMGMGIFIMMSFFSAMSYFRVLPYGDLAIVSLLLAIIGGGLALIHPNRSR